MRYAGTSDPPHIAAHRNYHKKTTTILTLFVSLTAHPWKSSLPATENTQSIILHICTRRPTAVFHSQPLMTKFTWSPSSTTEDAHRKRSMSWPRPRESPNEHIWVLIRRYNPWLPVRRYNNYANSFTLHAFCFFTHINIVLNIITLRRLYVQQLGSPQWPCSSPSAAQASQEEAHRGCRAAILRRRLNTPPLMVARHAQLFSRTRKKGQTHGEDSQLRVTSGTAALLLSWDEAGCNCTKCGHRLNPSRVYHQDSTGL